MSRVKAGRTPGATGAGGGVGGVGGAGRGGRGGGGGDESGGMARGGVGESAGTWARRGLVGLQGLTAEELRVLLRAARRMAPKAEAVGRGEIHVFGPGPRPLLGKTVANLFFEDSTRTRVSFTLAARSLGADVVDLASAGSSVKKGETIGDTARNLEAMGVHGMVVRHRACGAAEMVSRAVRCPVINAGDGKHEHPTQGLLDTYTLAERFDRLEHFDLTGLRVAIVGDVVSSRVARSDIAAMTALGARVVCVGPAEFVPASLAHLGVEISRDLEGVLAEVDAVNVLRIQVERHGTGMRGGSGGGGGEAAAGIDTGGAEPPSFARVREYVLEYGLNERRAGMMKAGAIVMHPGPINRGVELDADVADGARSAILRQVTNGVAVRMAVLALCVGAGAG